VSTTHKPTVEDLGVDVAEQDWQRSGSGDDAVEVAFAEVRGQLWVLLRRAVDGSGRVLVYNRAEWEAFIAGAKDGEFDDAI
jgi:hypothetical protein